MKINAKLTKSVDNILAQAAFVKFYGGHYTQEISPVAFNVRFMHFLWMVQHHMGSVFVYLLDILKNSLLHLTKGWLKCLSIAFFLMSIATVGTYGFSYQYTGNMLLKVLSVSISFSLRLYMLYGLIKLISLAFGYKSRFKVAPLWYTIWEKSNGQYVAYDYLLIDCDLSQDLNSGYEFLTGYSNDMLQRAYNSLSYYERFLLMPSAGTTYTKNNSMLRKLKADRLLQMCTVCSLN